MKKKRKKTWEELQENKCPKCGAPLQKDMLGLNLVGCQCGFLLQEETKDLLVKRDKDTE